ncbi:MAG: hypothetical protein QOJ44_1262 [Acidimicrobiaceae bacterium]|nr:hypothetical protein [Acidimicrobiaceae bacterium]
MNPDTIANELYGLRPEEFTAARDARAAAARRDGDRELASAIKKLRRPTPAAWLVNLLAREYPDRIVRLLELGSHMRQAQSALAAADLRRLSRERRTVVGGLVSDARDLARSAGQSVSEASWRELETTLEAALADADAGKAIQTGRLTTGMSYSGLGPVDLSGAVATPTSKREDRRVTIKDREPDRRGAGEKQRKGIEAAELAVREAEAAVDSLEREADELGRRLHESRQQKKQSRQDIHELERQIQDLRTVEDRATAAQSDAEQKLNATKRKMRTANGRVVRARGALKALSD